MYLIYTPKLVFYTKKINVRVQKIDKFYLYIFGIVIIDCLVQNKLKKIRFFQENFLLTNISLEIVLEIFFLIFSKANIYFIE